MGGAVRKLSTPARVLRHFKDGRHAFKMNRYTNAELACIHIGYGLANGNRIAAVRLYREGRFGCISSEAATESSKIRSAASELGKMEHGSFRATIKGTGWP